MQGYRLILRKCLNVAGLDIDALRDVANAVNGLKRPDSATLMVTHYKRLLNYLQPDFVHVMEAGRIIYSGDISVADVLEKDGYEVRLSAINVCIVGTSDLCVKVLTRKVLKWSYSNGLQFTTARTGF